MEFLNTIINFASAIVIIYGATNAINGVTTYGEGKKQNNPGKQDEGMHGMIGGGIIIVAGAILVPQLVNLFPTV